MSATTTTFTVAGMTCGHCAAAVTEEITALEGVTGVEVDVDAGRVTVVADTPPAEAAVRDAVEEAGYELVGSAGS